MKKKKIKRQKEKDEKAKANTDLPIKPVSAPAHNSSIPVSAEPEIIKQENSIMEIHHHGHVHEKKKWKEYVFQFLMLFLAVFCGFLAEYQLEHTIEKDRARQYIKSFYEDLKTDTTEYSKVIASYKSSVKALENRKECYDSIKYADSDKCLVKLLFNSSKGFTDLITADQTLQQLKTQATFASQA